MASMPRSGLRAWTASSAATGEQICGYNSRDSNKIASITKIFNLFTAFSLCDQFNIDPQSLMIQVSKYSSSIRGTTANLKEGDTLSLNDLFYCMMLPSGNDAASVIAEHLGGYLANCSISKNRDGQNSLQTVKGSRVQLHSESRYPNKSNFNDNIRHHLPRISSNKKCGEDDDDDDNESSIIINTNPIRFTDIFEDIDSIEDSKEEGLKNGSSTDFVVLENTSIDFKAKIKQGINTIKDNKEVLDERRDRNLIEKSKFHINIYLQKINSDLKERLGLVDTVLGNVHGMYHQDSRSSSAEVASAFYQIISNIGAHKIMNSQYKRVFITRGNSKRYNFYKNTNQLLEAGFVGKTGMTPSAKGCLVTETNIYKKGFIIVVLGCLNSKSRFLQTKLVAKWIKDNFKSLKGHRASNFN